MRAMLVAGAALGALGVLLGAFGAHALDGVLSARAREWYDTAVAYHAAHALALFACGLLSGLCRAIGTDAGAGAGAGAGAASVPTVRGGAYGRDERERRCRRACRLAGAAFALGIGLFSGSLYLMAFTGWTRLGIVTPFGGLALIGGWSFLAIAALRLPDALSSNASPGRTSEPSPGTYAGPPIERPADSSPGTATANGRPDTSARRTETQRTDPTRP